MRPQRPYLLRAFYDWIVDSDCTPHILVDAQRPGLRVPSHAIVEGKVTLNVSPRAVRELLIDEAGLSFQGRFGGSPFAVYVPLNAVVAIYARETGAGTAWTRAGGRGADLTPVAGAPSRRKTSRRPKAAESQR